MTRTPKNPAAEVAPVPLRVPPQAGGPGPVARVTGPGGTTPHPVPATPTQPVPGEAVRPRGSRERAAEGMIPSPVTGAPLPSLGTAPARGRTRTPAGTGTGGRGTGRAGSADPAGTTGRTFTIALPAGLKLLSLNDRLHFGERHRRTQDLKRAACVLALSKKIPRLERVSVVVEYQPRDRRERDADNISPSGKAALDGIVAAKVLVDDSKAYVTGVECIIGEPYPLGRLVLHLTEVNA